MAIFSHVILHVMIFMLFHAHILYTLYQYRSLSGEDSRNENSCARYIWTETNALLDLHIFKVVYMFLNEADDLVWCLGFDLFNWNLARQGLFDHYKQPA